MFGGLGFWELFIILIVIFLIVILPIYLIFKLGKKFGQNSKSDNQSERLRKLELLKKDNLISDEEFEKKKTNDFK